MVKPHRPSDLGGLADPRADTGPLALGDHDSESLQRFLHDMLRIRIAEEEVAELVGKGLARAPCHLGIGQEAIAVGVSAHLRATDRVFGGHRSHSHFLALGGSVYTLLAEVLGKADGTSRGMGGSMHLFGPEVGFHGSVPLVGATIPIAVGAALAAKMDGKGAVAVAYFGDGATEEGVFHESLNLAVNFELPVLFVCENNLFASHLDIVLRQPSDRVARFAEAHKVTSATVDGNDVVAVAKTANELITRARAGKGPGFLEAITYRHRGHVGPREDIDVGVRRKRADLEAWKRRDPIPRLFEAMRGAGHLTKDDFRALEAQLRTEGREASRRAQSAAYPPVSALLGLVYVGGDR